jgi:hypothetical protein
MPSALPALDILSGALASRSRLEDQRGVRAYLSFCSDAGTACESTSLAGWRIHLA